MSVNQKLYTIYEIMHENYTCLSVCLNMPNFPKNDFSMLTSDLLNIKYFKKHMFWIFVGMASLTNIRTYIL